MLVHPAIDPIAFNVGPLKVHWYGVMYLFAFIQFLLLGRLRLKQPGCTNWTLTDLDDLVFYGVLGVILGGRLGEIFLYHPVWYFNNPLSMFEVWKGGMSFHGGLIGVLIALAIFSYKRKRSYLDVVDFVAPLVPLGYAFGRIGNFINAELVGRVVRYPEQLPWAMVFPTVDNLPRHPSQLYHALFGGVLLFSMLWWLANYPHRRGTLTAVFAIGYGLARIVTENYRTPDFEVSLLYNGWVLTSGQLYSIPLVLVGIFILWWAAKFQKE